MERGNRRCRLGVDGNVKLDVRQSWMIISNWIIIAMVDNGIMLDNGESWGTIVDNGIVVDHGHHGGWQGVWLDTSV